jgi:APA family basic amino acid/polyamine antiporter
MARRRSIPGASVPVAGEAALQPGPDTELKRAITPGLLLLFIVGDILGGGIYALVGEVGAETGGAIWAAFGLALLMAVFTAGSYAELVSKYPHAGGAALYVHRAYRSKLFASAAALASAFGGDYLSVFIEVDTIVAALCLLAVIAAVNLRGISESVKLNVGFTVIELCGLLLIVLIAAVAIGQGDADVGRAFEFKEGSSIFAATLAGAALAFYALIGFEDSVNVAEETRDPARTFPKVLFGGLLIAGAVYLLVTIGAAAVVPVGDLAASDGPLLEVVKQGPLGIDTKVFSAIGLLALSNGALINLIMASRLLYGMSRERVLPRPFSRVLPERRTPWVAIGFVTLLAAVLVITGNLEKLADTTVALLVIVFAIVNVTVLVLRREEADHDHFRVPWPLPVIGVAISLALLTQVSGEAFVRAGILVALGAILWAINWFFVRDEPEEPAAPQTRDN